jgi:hypothetical protein
MATYEIDAPDGNTYQIDGPEGASDADVRMQVLAQHPEAGQAPHPAAVNPFNRQLGADVSYGAPFQPPPTVGEQVGGAYLGGLSAQLGALKGASRALEANLPFVDRAVAAAKTNLPQGYGGTGQPYAETLPAEQAKNAAFAQQNPWTNAVGGLVASAPLAAVPGVGEGGLAAQAGKFGLLGGVTGGIQGASESPDLTNLSDVGRNAAIGAGTGLVAGAAAPVGASLVGKVASPFVVSPERQALVDALRQAGVSPTAGQVTGNRTLAKLEAAASDIPFGGGGAEAAREANSRAFTQAILGKAGIEGELANPETLAAANDALGNRFGELSARNALVPDGQLSQDLAKAQTNYESLVSPSARAPGVSKIIDDFSARAPAQPSAFPVTDYPMAGDTVSGLTVRDYVPNMDSIESSFTKSDLLPGVREVPFSDFSGMDEPTNKVRALADSIKQSGEINPLIVAMDEKGPYILEGANRYDALQLNGHPTFPARVVVDRSDEVSHLSGGVAKPMDPIPGDAYQATRSRLTNQAQSLRFSDPPQAQAYRDIRDALDNAMDRSISANNPADAGEWARLRSQYGNYKDIEKAAASAGAGAAEGILSPAQMRTALASGKNRGAYARGVGDLAPLTNAGNAILTNFPQSGTAPRLLAARVLGAAIPHVVGGGVGYKEEGLPGLAAGVALPALAARTLMSQPAQSLLANQLMRGGGALPFAVNRGALAAALAGGPQLSRSQRSK